MTKSARSRKARRAEWEAAPGPWSDSEAEMLAATSYVPKKSSCCRQRCRVRARACRCARMRPSR